MKNSGSSFWEKELYPPIAFTKHTGVDAPLSGENLKGKKLLDHGCGTGIFGAQAKGMGADVIGVDISEKLLKEAAKHIKTKRADMTKLPFHNSEFDYVLSLMVLHTTKDIEKAVGEIARVLKHGGKLLMAVVHPSADKWTKEGKPIEDKTNYDAVEKRKWIFNLTDGRHFSAEFWRRPLEDYLNTLSKFFDIECMIEPALPKEYADTGKYAKKEFLFMKLVRR